MTIPITLGEFSALLTMVGIVPYIVQIVRGKVRPHRVSWFVWTFILALTLWSYHGVGAADSAWFIVGDLVATGLVFVLSLWRGKGGYSRFDVACLVIALVSLLIGEVCKMPLVTLLGTMVADGIGVVLTIGSSVQDPESESAVPFAWSSIGAVFGFLAVGEWNLLLLFYPFYLFLANFLTATVVMVGKYQWRRFSSSVRM